MNINITTVAWVAGSSSHTRLTTINFINYGQCYFCIQFPFILPLSLVIYAGTFPTSEDDLWTLRGWLSFCLCEAMKWISLYLKKLCPYHILKVWSIYSNVLARAVNHATDGQESWDRKYNYLDWCIYNSGNIIWPSHESIMIGLAKPCELLPLLTWSYCLLHLIHWLRVHWTHDAGKSNLLCIKNIDDLTKIIYHFL